MSSSLEDDSRAAIKPDESQVYLLTGKDYRISRSIKASWFLDNFNKVIAPNPDDVIKSSSKELEVLSVLPKPTSDHSDPCIVVPSTLITFLGRIYKFVFCLDVSQSLASVDIQSGKVGNEISFESFENCMRGLVLPFSVPGSSLELSPELHVTVLGYNGVMDCGTVQVLVEGCLVTQDNVEIFLSSVYQQLQQMENKNARVAQTVNENYDGKQPFCHVTSELSIVAMLKMSILALELLPGTASGGVVIISDGVFGLPNAAMVHALLAQLRSHTVCCSFIKVGSPFQAHCSFGYIPNTDLMKFLANATSGAYMSKAPCVKKQSCDSNVNKDLPQMNFYHEAFLCWSFQWEYDLRKIYSWEGDQDDVLDKRSNILSLHQWDKALTEPLIRKRHAEKTLRTTISSVLSIRLREGYCIKDISFLRGGKELVVKLLLPWKQNAYIEYTAAATWPIPLSNAVTKIEIVVQGTYGFLHDVYSKQLYSMKGYRANVVETFNHTLKNLEMTDALLVSLQSFSSNQLYYSTPECVRRGVPLFYFPPNSPQPVLVLEHGKSKKSSKSQEAQFAVFWRTVLTLDVNTWQRWMHCHRINMVLEHDRPLPKSLFLPSPNDRFYHIQCRNSLSSLAAFLKQWSSFVLAENHTYIKFVQGKDPEDPPKSFCIVRISSKAPCIVIRIAFLGGTPGKERHEIVNSLRKDLKAIKAQFAPSWKWSKNSRKENEAERQMLVCTKFLHKPLDRILVRYDEQPKNFLVRPAHSQQSTGIIETYKPWMHRAKGMPESPLKVLSRFLYHQRWVFTLHPKGLGSTATPNTVSKILRRLTEIRENQGYRFVASNLGVTTMFKEFWVKEADKDGEPQTKKDGEPQTKKDGEPQTKKDGEPQTNKDGEPQTNKDGEPQTNKDGEPQTTCIVQFVMFPPLTSSSHNRVAGWALDNRLPEDERELELVVEVWVEPQHGAIVKNEIPEYLVGKQYFEIPAKIFEADIETISAWLSYDHICRMCDDRVVNSPDEAVVHIQSPTSDPNKKSIIYEVPFPFDVMKVLGRSRQAELWFSTLIEHERPVSSRSTYHRCNDILFEYILEHMERLHDRQLTLTAEDSQRFLDFSLQRIGIGKPNQDKNITWRCFTRTENSHLLLTFLPASFQDLQDFAAVVKDLESRQSDVDPSLESKPSVMFRKRQASTCSRTLDTDRQESSGKDSDKTVGKFWRSRRWSQRSCVDLSLFVYDFALSSLTDDNESFEDILLDYRNRLAQFEQNTSLEKSKELRSHCMALYELFLYCFVSTVFESLRRGEQVDDDNLDEVLAICSDHIPEEIDIFGFLGNVCGHIKHPSNADSECKKSLEDWKRIHEQNAINFLRSNHDVNSSQSLWASKCEELDGLHDFIQQRFNSVLQKYFLAIPNKRDHYFYHPHFLQDSYQSDHSEEDESDEENMESNSEPDSVVFEESIPQSTDETESENLKSTADTNTDDFTSEGSVQTPDLLNSESEEPDYPSDQSDLQSSMKDETIMKQLEEEYNVPLFLSLNCTVRDKSHLSNAMVSMPAAYLPACFDARLIIDFIYLCKKLLQHDFHADILDQAYRDPEQIVDPSISTLQVTLDLICLVPPREPDYSRLKSRSRYRTRSSSVSSLSSDSPHEKMVKFENIDGAQQSVSVTASHDRESSLLVSGLPLTQIESIRKIRDDINWLLQDEIVFSLCHVPFISKSILRSVTEHIIKSQEVEASSSRFISMKLDFVLDQEKSLSIFMEELDKIRIGGYKLSRQDDYLYLRLAYLTSLDQCSTDECITEHEKCELKEDQDLEDDDLSVCFGSLFSNEGDFSHEKNEKSSCPQSPALDSFSEMWLILRKSESDVIDVLFYARDGEYYYDLYTDAINEIKALCHLVNQKMLLRYVYDNKICHPLLQPRSEADIWNESVPYSSPAHSVLGGIDGSQVVLQEYRYQAGYFKCPAKWTADLPIHFRLKGNSKRNSGADRAKQALRTELDKFSLNEKSSMYVYQEKNGNIFYFNLDSSLCLSKEAEIEDAKDNFEVDENNQSPAVSPVSSFQSYPKTIGTAELEDELDEFSRKTSAGLNAEKDTISLNDSMNVHVQECIKLTVHGVTEPSDEIKVDLVNFFQNRLDDYTLELLTMAVARNPNTKLALQDVQFIQPTGSPPSPFIKLVLPSFAAKNLHPFAFFFKQHLLNYVHTPKYTTQTENDHFKKFIQANQDCSEPLPESDVFVFTKAFTPGGKGVACISVSIVDVHGNALQIKPEQKEIGYLSKEMESEMEEITMVVSAESPELLPDDAIVVEISVWERGDVSMTQLKERLKKSVRHALCDVVMEYYLLTASFSCIPDQYLKPSSKISNYKTPHKPSTFIATHRKTPSAGSLGCGRAASPKAQLPRTFRSLSSSPVWQTPTTSGVFKVKTPEIMTTPPKFESTGENCSKSVSDQTDLNDSKTKEAILSIPSDKECKHRSHSEGWVVRKSSTHFRPIGRSFSNPSPPGLEVDKGENKSGRFSPYETFTENELTESREFGEEAVKANIRSTANKTSRTKSTESDNGLEMKEREVEEERRKYENGEKGKLHPSFQGLAQELMQFAGNIDSPSMLVQKETLLTRYSVDAVLYELKNMVKNLCPDLNSRIYRAVPSSPVSSCDPSISPTTQYVLYDPIRPPLQASNDQETAVDVSGSYMATSTRPAASFLFISRNIIQWRHNEQKLHGPCHVQSDKEFYPSQQFQSWRWNPNDEASERGRSAAFSNCAPGFVSRQRLILIDIRDKEILATTYNLSNEINTQFSVRLAHLVNWNNARCHLVSCLFQQKMGLFYHSTFQGLETKSKEMNQFCETVNDHHLFSLLKQTAPSLPEKSSSSQKHAIPSVGKLLFEETLRDVVPPRPLQTTKHCTYRDPVKRHGAQFQEIRAIQIRKAVQNAELQKLFTSWLRRGGLNHSTGDSSINLLKRQSRLVHCCKTPFLVCDEWISSVEEKASMNQVKQNSGDNNEPAKAVKEDTWHYKLREEFINYYTQFLQSQKFALVQLTTQSTKVQRKTTKPARKKAVSERPKHMSEVEKETKERQLHHYLQKTIDGSEDDETYAYDGGIMLVELGFEGCHFSVKLYAFESSRLLSSKNLNQQVQANFLAECSKVRDLTHLNSFSYDFHLRHVQYFLSGQRSVFPRGFKLTSMLSKLMNVYIYPPKFSWNHLCKGRLSLPLLRLSCETVFNYIVERCGQYNISAVEMNTKDGKQEHALVSTSFQDQYEFSLVAKLDLQADEGQLGLKFYVVKSNRQQIFPKMKPEISRRKQSSGFTGDTGIRLRQPLGPSPEREPVFFTHGPGMENIKRSSSSPLFITPLPLSQSPSEELLRHLPHTRESQNSLNPQKPLNSKRNPSSDRPYIIAGLEADPSDTLMAWDLRNLGQDADKFYHKLQATVSSAQKDCLRDHLWHLLLKGASSEESANESQVWKPKGRKKADYRRSPNDFTDTWAVPSSLRDVADSINQVTLEDFERLLELVKPFSLPRVDEMLKPFLSMNTNWYFNVWSTLLSKFGESSMARVFIWKEFLKSDSKVHYFVLFNPNNLDMFLLIDINEEKRRSGVKIIYRVVPEESKIGDRVIPKSGDEFITEVVNVFCYQMWTGLIS